MNTNSQYHTFLAGLKFSTILLLAIWGIFSIGWVFSLPMHLLGTLPRSIYGIGGVLSSPFIHKEFLHLFNNSSPLFVLSLGVFYFYRPLILRVFAFIILFSGFFVWLFGSEGWHFGASGLVYGLAGFLFFGGVFRKHRSSIAISLLVAFLYGGMIWGVLPLQEGVSWESHLFGGIAGLLLSYHFRSFSIPSEETPPVSSVRKFRDEIIVEDLELWNYEKHFPTTTILAETEE